MGATALVAEVIGTCGSLAAGAAVGSTCTYAHERCGGRVCHCQSGVRPCDGGPLQICVVEEGLGLAVECAVHEAEIPKGVLGLFTDNEPVIGVRTRLLPFAQAIGKHLPKADAAVSPAWNTYLSRGSDGGAAGSPAWPSSRSRGEMPNLRSMILGEGLQFEKYSFSSFRIILPDMSMGDDVVIGFGVRTVLRVPILGIASAPLDFDVLGAVQVPLRKLLQAPQPLEVCVPIVPKGESLQQVVVVSMTVHATEAVVCHSYRASNAVAQYPAEFDTAYSHDRLILDKGISDLMHCGNAAEHGIHVLDDQLQRMSRRQRDGAGLAGADAGAGMSGM